MIFEDGQRERRPARRRTAAVVVALFGVLALVLLASPGAARAQRRVEVYAPKHRLAAELEPLAATALAGNGEVAVDRGTNRLVLVGEADAVASAMALLAERDRALRRVVLRYDTRRESVLAAQGFDVRWGASVGAVRLGRLRTVAGPDGSLRVRAGALEERLVATLRGQMRVVEGGSTRIETGLAVPYSTTGAAGTNTQIVDATTGFEAKPRILADGRVRVDLASFADRLRSDGAIASMRASTLVELEPGTLVVVGSIDQDTTKRRAAAAPVPITSGAGAERGQDATLLLLRADVEE